MAQVTRVFSKIFSLLLILFVLAGCDIKKDNVSEDYDNYKFDPLVIERLPLYDSLAMAITQNYPVFRGNISETESYRAYRYMPSSTEAEVFTNLPADLDTKVAHYYTQLGKDFIYGFDVFKDSSIKIYVRNKFSSESKLDLWENLSYYPPGTNMRRREFPDKDTVLNEHWQYWVRFAKSGLF
jgi:hypothetical protein